MGTQGGHRGPGLYEPKGMHIHTELAVVPWAGAAMLGVMALHQQHDQILVLLSKRCNCLSLLCPCSSNG
jgi:hypothetical protein